MVKTNVLQTSFYEFYNKNHKINTNFFSPCLRGLTKLVLISVEAVYNTMRLITGNKFLG